MQSRSSLYTCGLEEVACLSRCYASLVAQLVKNLLAMRHTPVRFLGLEDPLKKGMATHSSMLAWRIHSMDCIVHGVAKSGTGVSHFHFPDAMPVETP